MQKTKNFDNNNRVCVAVSFLLLSASSQWTSSETYTTFSHVAFLYIPEYVVIATRLTTFYRLVRTVNMSNAILGKSWFYNFYHLTVVCVYIAVVNMAVH